LSQFLVRPASIAVSIHHLRVKSKSPTIRPDRLFIAFPLKTAIPLLFPRVSTTPIQERTRRTKRLQVLTSPLLALLQVRIAGPKMQRLVIGFKGLIRVFSVSTPLRVRFVCLPGGRKPVVGAAFITTAWVSPERGRDECCPIGVKVRTDELTMRSVQTCLSSRVSHGIDSLDRQGSLAVVWPRSHRAYALVKPVHPFPHPCLP